MLCLKQIFAMAILFAAVGISPHAQPILKPPVEISPKIAYKGEALWIKVNFTGDGCWDYPLTWKVEPTPISSVLTWYLILNIKATRSDACIPIRTPMDAQDTLKNLSGGRYIVRFDSLSDVRYDLRDTVTFTVQNIPNPILTRFGEKQEMNFETNKLDLLGRKRRSFQGLRLWPD